MGQFILVATLHTKTGVSEHGYTAKLPCGTMVINLWIQGYAIFRHTQIAASHGCSPPTVPYFLEICSFSFLPKSPLLLHHKPMIPPSPSVAHTICNPIEYHHHGDINIQCAFHTTCYFRVGHPWFFISRPHEKSLTIWWHCTNRQSAAVEPFIRGDKKVAILGATGGRWRQDRLC